MSTTTPLTKALARLKGSRRAKYHPIRGYIEAVEGIDYQVRSFIGGGSDCLVFELESGNVLKLGGRTLSLEMGSRPFDVPLFNKRTITLEGGFRLYLFEQPKGNPVTMAQMRQFQKSLPEDYYFTDAKPENLVELNGEIKLSDYWAVQWIGP